ncbi:MAG: HlyC/CorC family transporter [Clostridiaceae bacterium]|nr:HlyC/CorC family transporter [Clostridiaceae bacterium]
MFSCMTTSLLQAAPGEAGISTGAAIFISFLLLVLFGMLTGFRKAVCLLPREREEQTDRLVGERQSIFHRCLQDPAVFNRRITIAQIFAGAAYLYWGSLLTIPAMIQWTASGMAGWLTWIYSAIFLFLLLLFGLAIPQRTSGARAGSLARWSWYFLSPLILLASLADLLLHSISSGIMRLLRLRDIAIPQPAPTEEEFLQMLEAGHAVGAIEDDNRELIANLFEFDDKIAGEVMTHRTDIEALPAGAGIEETMAFLYDTKYTRFPVFEGTVDNIVGVLHVKDLLFYREQTRGKKGFTLSEIMRPAWFTPETRNISDLFRDMQQNHIQMAIVIDEYGGTAGLLTIEDLIEQIVGNIEDEYDEAEQEMIEIAPGNWLVEGSYPVDKLARVTGVPLDDDEYDTVAGLVIDLLDRIPAEDERPVVSYRSLTFHVLAVSDNRIVRVRVTRTAPEADYSDD